MDHTERPAREALIAFCREGNELALRAAARGEPLGWASTKFPPELAGALGLVTCCPESRSAALALGGQSGPLCAAAEKLGYDSDLCSYPRISLAQACGCGPEELALPRPDFLLCCNNICTTMMTWYENLARVYNVPLLLLDVPYTGREEPSPALMEYLRGQFRALAGRLAALTGREWSEARFEEACRSSARSAEAWNRVCALQTDPLCPIEDMELFDYMPALVSRKCDPALPGLLEALEAELRALPRRAEPARFRLMLEGTPCWPHLQAVLGPLRQAGLSVAADTITPSLGFAYRDLDGLLRAACGTINGSPLPSGIRIRRGLCESRRVDGVLIHYNRSCRPWCGTLPLLGQALAADGYAAASFTGDQADPKVFSQGQFSSCLQALVEMLEEKKNR